MYPTSRLPSRCSSTLTLREAVAAVLGGAPDRHAVGRLVDESYRFALAYLKQKVRQRRLQLDLFGLALSDLALDCFADLFERDEQGQFPQIATYFTSVAWEDLDEDALRVALRRLVFSKVNEGLFRRYREADPNLAKVVRNVKNAARADETLSLVRRKEGTWLAVDGADEDQLRAPLAPPELVEGCLVGALCQGRGLRGVVGAFADFCRLRPEYAPGYPLVQFAQCLRAAFVRIGERVQEEEGPPPFLTDEVRRAIDLVTEGMQDQMHGSYVARGKVDADTFGAYFRAIGDVLASDYVSGARPVGSYFDALQMHLPELSKGAYRHEHRHVMEYLAKISRSHLLHYLSD